MRPFHDHNKISQSTKYVRFSKISISVSCNQKCSPKNHLLPNHLPKHTSSIRIMSQCGGFAWLSIVCNCMAFAHLLLPPPAPPDQRPNIRFGWTLAVAINYKRNSMKEWLSWPHDSATYCTQRSHPFAPEHTNSYTSTRQCAKTAEKYIYYTHFASARAFADMLVKHCAEQKPECTCMYTGLRCITLHARFEI